MRNSRVLHIFLLLALNFWGASGTAQLDGFLKAVDDAHLEGLWADGVHPRKRSASIGELLARFDLDEDEAELQGGDAWYQSFRAMECQYGGCRKKPLRWISRKVQPDEYDDYYEDVANAKDLKDQREETANDLSHEANYKLSKMEQDAAEKSLPGTAWPVHHSIKRRVDPMNAVKLKTSLRMLKNGEGAFLPSSILSGERGEDLVYTQKRQDRVDPWKETYEVREGRRLLSIEDPMQEARSIDLQQFDNLKQKTPLDRQLSGLMFDNTQPGNGVGVETNNEQYKKKNEISVLSDDLMQTDAFLKLQNFLQENQGNKSASVSGQQQSTQTVPLNLVDKDHDVNIKLHMSVNATVLGEDKLPAEFHRNKTITIRPPTEKAEKTGKLNENDEGKVNSVVYRQMSNQMNGEVNSEENSDDLSRDTRRVVFPIMSAVPKRGMDGEISKSVPETSDNFPMDDVVNGKLTSQLVRSVFDVVKTSPTLKVLWPGLMRNKVPSSSDVQSFNVIRTQDNGFELQRTEDMIRQAMESINAIIEQQVRSKSCVPLPPDLKAFYNLIIQTQLENQRSQARRKRESEADPISDTDVRKKSKIVKKLLRDYEELPREDQEQVAIVKRRLLVAAEQLRELQQQSQRRKRQIMELHFKGNHSEAHDTEQGLSPEYVKLTKTAELLLHNSFKDPDLPLDFGFI